MLRPSTSRGWPALGCADSRSVGHRRHPLDRLEHRRRTDAQLTPMTVAPRRSSSGANRSGGVPSSVLPSSSVVICATIGRSDTLRTASIAAPISFRSRNVSRMNRSTPPSASACACSRKYVARLVDAGLAPRLDADAERADRAGDVGADRRAAWRAIFAPCALIVVQLVGEAERAELDAVGAERVGLDDVGAGADVLLVHLGDEIRLREVQRVEALVDEDALRVQHRPHRAVADEHALVERFEKRRVIAIMRLQITRLPDVRSRVEPLASNVSASISR